MSHPTVFALAESKFPATETRMQSRWKHPISFSYLIKISLIRSISTRAGPYGVAYDREGRRLLVAAAKAQMLQVYDADALQLMAEVPVGQRCWHFTFTPDDSKILLACGRSNDVHIIDAKTYRPIRVLKGLQMPWGIVTYPRAYGSLDLP